MTPNRSPESGMTLIEVMVGLSVFALIGTASYVMLDQVLQSRRHGDQHLQRLAQVQRGFALLDLDTRYIVDGSLRFGELGVSLDRHSSSGTLTVSYELKDGTFWRVVRYPGLEPVQRQPLLSGISGVTWATFSPKTGWTEPMPREGGITALDVTLAFPSEIGTVHRTLALTTPLLEPSP